MKNIATNHIRKSQPEPEPRLPIKLDATSNGEHVPAPLSPEIQWAKRRAMERAAEQARRLGLSRRQFLSTACGTATTLLCINDAFGRGGHVGGYFDVNPRMTLDLDAATRQLAGDEFIFDIQTHHVNPMGAWRQSNPRLGALTVEQFMRALPQARCGERDIVACFSVEQYIKEIFLDSDTTMAILTAVPAVPDQRPLTTEEAAATRLLVETTFGSPRVQIHGMVTPNIQMQSQLDGMQRLAEQYHVKAWKCYTHFDPDGPGWFLDDEAVGIPFIQKARETGIKRICVHKGLSLPTNNQFHATCRDMGVVAKMFPDVTFIVYHSGYEMGRKEGPYDPGSTRGLDTLIKSLQDHAIPPNSNVYAELGATWRNVMRNPTEAAHVVGKLLKYVGEDRVVWGTDCIWYGSPQDQIEAFRAFQISESFQEQYGYPALTPAIKAKIFGLSAAIAYDINPTEVVRQLRRDPIEKIKIEYRNNPQPSFATYGPKTRREFFNLLRQQHDG